MIRRGEMVSRRGSPNSPRTVKNSYPPAIRVSIAIGGKRSQPLALSCILFLMNPQVPFCWVWELSGEIE